MTNIADRVKIGPALNVRGEVMRDLLVGLAVAIFIALVTVYIYAPQVFHHWVNRLLFMN
jgi:hypothetical protein